LVFAEAPSFARLNDVDPSGWFFQAVLYNPTDSEIVVSGLRWRYNASEDIVFGSRDVRCYDSRYFFSLPVTNMPNGTTIWWEYTSDSISVTVPSKEIITTWIEVPTYSVNNDAIVATYSVEAYVEGHWISSPLYISHSGDDKAASTLFRADFNLTTDPNDEQQTHTNPEWCFNEDRYIIAGLSTRVRLIPVVSSRNTLGIDYAKINVTLPSGWSYGLGSIFNSYGENMVLHSVNGSERLEWNLETDILRYSTNQSVAQNYIEFNVTAPYVPGIHAFTVDSTITSLDGLVTSEHQNIYTIVRTPPNATFTYSPTTPLTSQNVTFNATASYDLDGQNVSYFWDFGDGNTGTGNITTHAYADNRNYTVMLTITDNYGLKDTAPDTIVVQNRPPFAQFTESAGIVDTGVVIYFNASESSDPDGSIVSYFWDFGDGTNATGITVSYAYVEDGNYTVKLTVTDDDGASVVATDGKTILNRVPVASFDILTQKPVADEQIIFDASSSYDPDGDIVSYEWTLGDGMTGSSRVISHSYASIGTYNLTLTVTDNDGHNNSVSKVLTVYLRDLAVLDLIPSANIVYVGENINISVVVGNEGTSIETFDIILYYDNNTIGRQTVVDLEAGTETTLRFRWDTTPVKPNVNYTIRAEAAGISGEKDKTDNTYVYGTIEVKSQSTSPPIHIYLVPALLGCLAFLLVGISLKKRADNREQTAPPELSMPARYSRDFSFLNELTDGGFPDAYSVMIIGGANFGKSVLCQQLAHKYLEEGKLCVYVTCDSSPFEIRENMKNFQWDITPYEQEETFKLIDAHSGLKRLDKKKKDDKQTFSLSDLNNAISAAISNLKQKPIIVFLDSIAPIFDSFDPSKVIEFLQEQNAKIKGKKGIFLFSIGEGTAPSEAMRRLAKMVEIADCIIELDVPKKGQIDWRMRVIKLEGQVIDKLIPFKIEMQKGIVFFPQD
jgi:KaiC/GvpD/RAD55 family RecA-like ATPase/PKD repeat protein